MAQPQSYPQPQVRHGAYEYMRRSPCHRCRVVEAPGGQARVWCHDCGRTFQADDPQLWLYAFASAAAGTLQDTHHVRWWRGRPSGPLSVAEVR